MLKEDTSTQSFFASKCVYAFFERTRRFWFLYNDFAVRVLFSEEKSNDAVFGKIAIGRLQRAFSSLIEGNLEQTGFNACNYIFSLFRPF